MKDIRKIIEEAIESLDGELMAGCWGVGWTGSEWVSEIKKCYCPLGAVLLKHQPRAVYKNHDVPRETVAAFLNVDTDYVRDFIWGLEGLENEDGFEVDDICSSEAYKLGHEFRERFNLTLGPK